MRLDHEFTVPAPIGEVWQAVVDPERVAPCMPGAALTKVEGDKFSGTVKVKLGPISLLYKGNGEFLDKDESARKVTIKASGKDSRGAGTAAATVTLTLTETDGGTHGAVATDLSITGKPAQFGRGLISEVGGKILDTFAGCLSGKLASPGGETESAGSGSAQAGSAGGASAQESSAQAGSAEGTAAKAGSASAQAAAGKTSAQEGASQAASAGAGSAGGTSAQEGSPQAGAAAAGSAAGISAQEESAQAASAGSAGSAASTSAQAGSADDSPGSAPAQGTAAAAQPAAKPQAGVKAAPTTPEINTEPKPKAADRPALHSVPAPPETDAIDLLDYAGQSVLKRVVPVLAGIAAVFGLVAIVRALRK